MFGIDAILSILTPKLVFTVMAPDWHWNYYFILGIYVCISVCIYVYMYDFEGETYSVVQGDLGFTIQSTLASN